MEQFSPLKYAELAYPLYEQVAAGEIAEQEFAEKLAEAGRLAVSDYPDRPSGTADPEAQELAATDR